MNLELNDPRLTAFALNELDDAERAEVARAVDASPELRAAVDEIRATAALLTSELRAEPAERLSEPERAYIESTVAAGGNGELVHAGAADISRPDPGDEAVRTIKLPRAARSYRALKAFAAVAASLMLVAWVGFNSLPHLDGTMREFSRVGATASGQRADEPVATRGRIDPAPNANEPGLRYAHDARSVEGLVGNRPEAIAAEIKKDEQGNAGLGGIQVADARGKQDAAARPLQSDPNGPSPASGSPEVLRRQSLEALADLPPSSRTGGSSTGAATAPQPAPTQAMEMHVQDRLASVRSTGASPKPSAMEYSQTAGAGYDIRNQTPAATGEGLFETQDRLGQMYPNPEDDKGNVQAPLAAPPTNSAGSERARFSRISNWHASIGPAAVKARRPVNGRVPGFDTDTTPCLPLPPTSNTESYDRIVDNPFMQVRDNPLSTFSIDVDTASYANMRRFLTQGQRPPPDSVRIEELVNYFSYDDPPPSEGEAPFSASMEVAQCPWQPAHRLVRIGLKGRVFPAAQRPACNLVFLIDVSGSMEPANKLPLLRQALKLLANQLGENDSVAMVVYAGASGLVLPATNGMQKQAILDALDRLQAGGCTNGAAGIELAYLVASQNLKPGAVNRVVLCTDGDFNVGVTNQGDLTRLIEEKAKTGVFLSVLGFGMGNLKDSTLEKLADKGNGNYAYIDTLNEARKVLVEQLGGTLVTIAKDVKIQVEFNPARVAGYRLIGYENRVMAAQDFNDDTKDAGEIGAGHTVTALYEVVPVGVSLAAPGVDPLKYQTPHQPMAALAQPDGPASQESLTLKLRYKEPAGQVSKLLEFPLTDGNATFAQSSGEFKFAAAVAGFGMLLRESPHKGGITFDGVLELAGQGLGPDPSGYRAEFVELVRRAKAMAGGR